MRNSGLGAILLTTAASGAHAQPASVQRGEVVLGDGMRRYAVPIKIGAADVVARLDSRSTGLRILPNVLKAGDVQPSSRDDTYSYGAGAKLSGVVASGVVSVGGLVGAMQLVKSVGCMREKPRCAAGSLPIER